MSLVKRFRRLVGAEPAQGLLTTFLEEGIWPRGGIQRYVCHGIPRDVLNALQPQIRSLADWDQMFSGALRRYRGLGDKQVEAGDPGLASRYYLVAASCAFHAQLLPSGEGRRTAELRHHCRAAFRQAAELLQPPVQLVQFTFDGVPVAAYYRRTPEAACGTVILLNSQQSCKEDMYYFTQPMLDAGLNTVLVDTPGTGEALPRLPLRDVEPIMAGLDAGLPALPGAPGSPVLLFSLGIGGAVALRLLAAYPDAFTAAALLSPPYDLQLVYDHLQPWVRQELAECLGCTAAQLPGALRRVACTGLGSRIAAPVLVIGGGKDKDFPRRQAKQLAETLGGDRGAYWSFGRATHGAYERQPQLRGRVAQWLSRQVGGAPGRVGFGK